MIDTASLRALAKRAENAAEWEKDEFRGGLHDSLIEYAAALRTAATLIESDGRKLAAAEKVIQDAPHPIECMIYRRYPAMLGVTPYCNCWKSLYPPKEEQP